jgi:indole-3-acetate monooxygenase
MQMNADPTLMEAAQRIAPVIREHNEEAERERRLSPPVLAALHESGLLRMFTPRSLGGLEVDPITRTLVAEEISRHDTAAGWTLCNPTGRTSVPDCRMREPKRFTATVPIY